MRRVLAPSTTASRLIDAWNRVRSHVWLQRAGIPLSLFRDIFPWTPLGVLLIALAAYGLQYFAYAESVDMNGLSMDDFVDGVIDIVTAGDFMDMTEGAQIVFI